MMDKATGEAFTDAEGNPVTAESKPFTAKIQLLKRYTGD